jgi:soluble P-type ATPase
LMRKAVVLDKSGTIFDPCRVIYDLSSKKCVFHENALRYVVRRGEALVNIRGAVGAVIKGDLHGVSFKASCAAFVPVPEVRPCALCEKDVLDGIRLVSELAQSHCNSELGVCVAVIVNRAGKVTGIVGLGGRLYGEVRDAVSRMQRGGSDVFLATGNCMEMTMKCAGILGIPKEYVLFDASPEDKRDLVKRLRGFYGAVVMVGNDINDLTAMREADISIIVRREGATSDDRVSRCEDVDHVVPTLNEVEGIVNAIGST